MLTPMPSHEVRLLDFAPLVKDERDDDGESRSNQVASDHLLWPQMGLGLADRLGRLTEAR